MPTFTNSWHSQHEPVWRSIVLPRLPAGKRRWIDLGSFEGQSALWILGNALRDGDELICCDIWPDVKVERLFDENTKDTPIVKVKQDAFVFLLDQVGRGMSATCVYVDAGHHARSVLEQATLSWRLLPVGGILIFDDYRWKHPPHKAGRLPPGLAIDAVIKCYATESILLHLGAQAVIQKRA